MWKRALKTVRDEGAHADEWRTGEKGKWKRTGNAQLRREVVNHVERTYMYEREEKGAKGKESPNKNRWLRMIETSWRVAVAREAEKRDGDEVKLFSVLSCLIYYILICIHLTLAMRHTCVSLLERGKFNVIAILIILMTKFQHSDSLSDTQAWNYV